MNLFQQDGAWARPLRIANQSVEAGPHYNRRLSIDAAILSPRQLVLSCPSVFSAGQLHIQDRVFMILSWLLRWL
jgi:hypothetical protein